MDREFIIIPYVQLDGIWSLKDSEIGIIFDRMIAENTLKRVFYDGKTTEKSQFLALCKSPDQVGITAWRTEKDPILFSWVNGIVNGRGFIHFCGFKSCSARIIIRAAHAMIKILAGQFDCLVGITPENITEAVHLSKMAGFHVLGTIPSLLYLFYEDRRVGGVISFLEGGRDGTW